MIDYNTLINNPELAKNIRFEITGENLLELASTVIKATRDAKTENKNEEYITKEEVLKMTNIKTKMTLWRWHKQGILMHNQIGLYKKSDVDRFLERK